MRKLLSILACGLAAVSFSTIAADTSTDTKAKADTGTGVTAGAGASTDVKADKKTRKATKHPKDKNAASGGSTTPRDTKEPAPAPAPTDMPKKTD